MMKVRGTLKFFISYSHSDRKLARRIKEYLDDLGLKSFLAHEDLIPSEDWQKGILKHLSNCDIFLPIITSNFVKSEWTDQESGIAFVKRKFIIPVEVDSKPYGFIGKYQSFKFYKKGSELENSCLRLVHVLQQSGSRIRASMLRTLSSVLLASSEDFEVFRILMAFLQFDHLSKKRLALLMEIALSKRAIRNLAPNRKLLIILFEKHKFSTGLEALKNLSKRHIIKSNEPIMTKGHIPI